MIKDTQISVPIYNFDILNYKACLNTAIEEFARINSIDKAEVFNYYIPYSIKILKFNTSGDLNKKYLEIFYIIFLPKYLGFFNDVLFKEYIKHTELLISKQLELENQVVISIEPSFNFMEIGFKFKDFLHTYSYFNKLTVTNFSKYRKNPEYDKLCDL